MSAAAWAEAHLEGSRDLFAYLVEQRFGVIEAQLLELADRSRLEACFQRFKDGTSRAEVLEPLQGMLPAAT